MVWSLSFVLICALIVVNKNTFFVAAAIGITGAHYGPGIGNIYLDNVACVGTEPNITSCGFTRLHNCGHLEDAGVLCKRKEQQKGRFFVLSLAAALLFLLLTMWQLSTTA